jgi:hypothetical protein
MTRATIANGESVAAQGLPASDDNFMFFLLSAARSCTADRASAIHQIIGSPIV